MKRRLKPKRLREPLNVTTITAIMLIVVASSLIVFSFRTKIVAAKSAPVIVVSHDDQIAVPVPVRAVARGEQLSTVQFTTLQWPAAKVKGDYMLNLEDNKSTFATTPLPPLLPIPLSSLSRNSLDANAVASKWMPSPLLKVGRVLAITSM